MCMFACNSWGALDGVCVHAWAGQGAFACMRVGMHVATSACEDSAWRSFSFRISRLFMSSAAGSSLSKSGSIKYRNKTTNSTATQVSPSSVPARTGSLEGRCLRTNTVREFCSGCTAIWFLGSVHTTAYFYDDDVSQLSATTMLLRLGMKADRIMPSPHPHP
jgi:hypothetical protein